MRVVLDPGTCSGTGTVGSVAPDAVEVGDDGALTVLEPEQPQERRALRQDAVASCPTGARSLAD